VPAAAVQGHRLQALGDPVGDGAVGHAHASSPAMNQAARNVAAFSG
jgi:hypothetical protein